MMGDFKDRTFWINTILATMLFSTPNTSGDCKLDASCNKHGIPVRAKQNEAFWGCWNGPLGATEPFWAHMSPFQGFLIVSHIVSNDVCLIFSPEGIPCTLLVQDCDFKCLTISVLLLFPFPVFQTFWVSIPYPTNGDSVNLVQRKHQQWNCTTRHAAAAAARLNYDPLVISPSFLELAIQCWFDVLDLVWSFYYIFEITRW